MANTYPTTVRNDTHDLQTGITAKYQSQQPSPCNAHARTLQNQRHLNKSHIRQSVCTEQGAAFHSKEWYSDYTAENIKAQTHSGPCSIYACTFSY